MAATAAKTIAVHTQGGLECPGPKIKSLKAIPVSRAQPGRNLPTTIMKTQT